MAEIPVNYEAFAEHLQKENAALRANLAEEKRQREELSKSFDRTIDREDALRAEVAKPNRMREIDHHLIDRLMPCPDCRDKVQEGECERCMRQKAESEVERLKTCCVIEAMIANPNVDSLIKQHEADLAAAVEVLRDVAEDGEYSPDDGDVMAKKCRAFLKRLGVRT